MVPVASSLCIVSIGRTDCFRSGVGVGASQPGLWTPSLEEEMEGCPLVVGLRGLVESLLGERLVALYGNGGGVPFEPSSIFCVWLYGYLEGERSSRRLERLCRYDLRYRYLSRGSLPDHTTLCRFRSRLSGILDELFQEVIEACRQSGLIRSEAMAVDGPKIIACRSQWRRALKESEALDEFESEAQTMLTTHGEYIVGYNIQAAVDTGSSVVLGFVATNQANDLNQLEAVLRETAKLSGSLPAHAVMDKGFNSASNASAAMDK